MRFLVAVVSAGAALTLIVASGLMNWVFMTSLGKSEFEQQILGAVSVAVSAFLALLPTLLLWAYRERRTLYILLGVPVFHSLRRVLAFLGCGLCRQEPRQPQRRPRARRGKTCGRQARHRRGRDEAESASALSSRSPSFRNLCAVLNKIAAGNPRNPARTRQPMPRALSAKAISS